MKKIKIPSRTDKKKAKASVKIILRLIKDGKFSNYAKRWLNEAPNERALRKTLTTMFRDTRYLGRYCFYDYDKSTQKKQESLINDFSFTELREAIRYSDPNKTKRYDKSDRHYAITVSTLCFLIAGIGIILPPNKDEEPQKEPTPIKEEDKTTTRPTFINRVQAENPAENTPN